MQTIDEHLITDIILFVDNTYDLAQKRDKVYESGGISFNSFIDACIKEYKRSIGDVDVNKEDKEALVKHYQSEYSNWHTESLRFLDSSDDVSNVLKQCTVVGHTVVLPPFQLERKLYEQVAQKLNLIGGRWNKKQKGFAFQEDPTKYLGKVQDGENVNLKKEFQYFPTPDCIAEEMVDIADIQPHHRVIEPSAGQGAIVKAILKACPELETVYCCELMELNRTFLNKINEVFIIENDFLQLDQPEFFDRIVANPPFTKDQDIEHIYHMYKMLKPGGVMVTLASPSWSFGTKSKHMIFRDWLAKVGGIWIDIEPGAFKESGTQIGVTRIKIVK